MRKKVVHIITRLTLGGAQENTIYTFINHDRNKYDVFLIAGGDESYGGSDYLKQLKDKENLILIKELRNSINPIQDIKALFRIYSILKKNCIDIVHTHSSKAGVLGRIAAKAAEVPVIVHTVHGWSFNDFMCKAKYFTYTWIERFAARLCDRLIVVTNRDIDKGLSAGIGTRNRYITIRSGIDFNKFKAFDKRKAENLRAEFGNKKIIGTIGRLSEQKNVHDFIHIAERLLKHRSDIHFVVIGDGPLRGQLEELADSLGLKVNITFMGIRLDTSDIYRTLDILLMTSLWEGLPRVIPEAMYCGVPVVANSIDGVSEIVNDGINGFTTVPYDLKDACDKVERLLDDTKIREMIIKNAYNTIYPEYEAMHMVQQIERLYECILSEKKNLNMEWCS